MECPLCKTQLRRHLLQQKLAIVSCPLQNCVYPFNLSVAELHENNLLITDVTTDEIMAGMKPKMIDNEHIDNRIAEFITRTED